MIKFPLKILFLRSTCKTSINITLNIQKLARPLPQGRLGPRGPSAPGCVWGPSPGINEHPIARMKTILRLVEAPVKIYNSKGSNHEFKLSGIGL